MQSKETPGMSSTAAKAAAVAVAAAAAADEAAKVAGRPSKTAFKSREEFKRTKELEEARKAGTAAPEVDEDGRDINPHIPQYISAAPWYVPTEGPTLSHQRNLLAADRKFDKLGSWYARGEKAGPAATRFRKGACENCGAITHKRKDCLERPRAKGARWTGADIVADDVVRDVSLDWEGKRDRWNGYDPKTYRAVHERHAKLEVERMKLKAEKLDRDLREGKPSRKADDTDDDDDDDNDNSGRDSIVMQQKDQATPATVRNLRIREDTAKYLRNLDVNSAYYDPKTRSMRADPNPHVGAEDKDFAGDNFVRYTGDVKDLARMELHALKATQDGRDLPHLLAEPTTAEEVFRDFASRKNAIEERRRADIIARYGGQEHSINNRDLSGLHQSETFVEYDREGKLVKGKETARPISKYPEDMFEGKHTTVWGSFYADGAWGYDCCHQIARNAYCTGEAGKVAARELAEEMGVKTEEALRVRFRKDKAAGEKRRHKEGDVDASASRYGSGKDGNGPEDKRQKLSDALRAQDAVNARFEDDDRRRGFNSGSAAIDGQNVTEEQVEAYRLRRIATDDPMAKFLTTKDFHSV
jgi:pre-mRNA-processing factor SLU7